MVLWYVVFTNNHFNNWITCTFLYRCKSLLYQHEHHAEVRTVHLVETVLVHLYSGTVLCKFFPNCLTLRLNLILSVTNDCPICSLYSYLAYTSTSQ